MMFDLCGIAKFIVHKGKNIHRGRHELNCILEIFLLLKAQIYDVLCVLNENERCH